jgi:hypothetical protein
VPLAAIGGDVHFQRVRDFTALFGQMISDMGVHSRIARLRERLHRGDPDMPADELQAAIERAEAKRRDLVESLPDADHRGAESSFPLPQRFVSQCRSNCF